MKKIKIHTFNREEKLSKIWDYQLWITWLSRVPFPFCNLSKGVLLDTSHGMIKQKKMTCVPSEDSDQPGHPRSLIRAFACPKCVAKDPMFLHADNEDWWSDWADAQADLSLRWCTGHFVDFVMLWLNYLLYHIHVCYRKFPKYSDTQKTCCNHSKIWTLWLYHRVMSPNSADGMANSADLGLHCLPRHICPKT